MGGKPGTALFGPGKDRRDVVQVLDLQARIGEDGLVIKDALIPHIADTA